MFDIWTKGLHIVPSIAGQIAQMIKIFSRKLFIDWLMFKYCYVGGLVVHYLSVYYVAPITIFAIYNILH